MDCLIQTCKRDWRLANIASAGLRKFWPGCNPRLFLDTDTATEDASVPSDIRDMIRKIPYLRRIFDFPRLVSTERFAVLDSDCLCYRDPFELESLAFQGNPGGGDRLGGLKVWERLGYTIPHQEVRFVAGLFTATMEMYEKRDLAYEYLRICKDEGYDCDCAYPAVVCEQGLVSGLWRLTYPHNPLPPKRYPFEKYYDGCAIWHTSSFRKSWADAKIEEYALMIGESQC